MFVLWFYYVNHSIPFVKRHNSRNTQYTLMAFIMYSCMLYLSVLHWEHSEYVKIRLVKGGGLNDIVLCSMYAPSCYPSNELCEEVIQH